MVEQSEQNIKKCQCGTPLKFRAEVAAPGFGQSWECPKCGKSYWVVRDSVLPWEDVDPEACTLTEEDVI